MHIFCFLLFGLQDLYWKHSYLGHIVKAKYTNYWWLPSLLKQSLLKTLYWYFYVVIDVKVLNWAQIRTKHFNLSLFWNIQMLKSTPSVMCIYYFPFLTHYRKTCSKIECRHSISYIYIVRIYIGKDKLWHHQILFFLKCRNNNGIWFLYNSNTENKNSCFL
jgi:hypothetical protein